MSNDISKEIFDPTKPGKYVFQATIRKAPEDVGTSGKLQTFEIEGSKVRIGVWKNSVSAFGQPLEVGTAAEIEIEVKTREDSTYMDVKCLSFGGKKEKPRGGWGGNAAKSDREIVANLIAQSQLAAATVLAVRSELDVEKTLDLFAKCAMSALNQAAKH